MKLSANFSLAELTKTNVRQFDNTPSMQVIDNLQVLVDNVLQPIRNKFGPVTVTSGYRSPEVNKAIGGSATSDHCFGFAADFEVAGVDNKELARWVADNLKFKQLILEFYTKGVPDSGWVHVSYDKTNLTQKVMTATRVGGRTVYSLGI
jgi:zinc D-Ala-D-Ala carboxypeptidase